MLGSQLQGHQPTQRIITSLTSSRPPYLSHQRPHVQGQLPPPLCHPGHHALSAHSLLFQAALLSQLAVTTAEMVDD